MLIILSFLLIILSLLLRILSLLLIRRPSGVSDPQGFVLRISAASLLRLRSSEPSSFACRGVPPPPDIGELAFVKVHRSSRQLHFEVPRRPRSPKSELQSPLPSEVAFSAAFASLFRLFPTSLKCFPLEPARAGAMFGASAFCARSYQKCCQKWL